MRLDFIIILFLIDRIMMSKSKEWRITNISYFDKFRMGVLPERLENGRNFCDIYHINLF